MEKYITLKQLTDDILSPDFTKRRMNNPDTVIRALKFFSPLEKEFREDILYVGSIPTWHVLENPGNCRMSMLIFGEYHGEFDWADNLIIYEDTPDKRKSVELIQRKFTDEITAWRQSDTLTNIVIKNKGLQYLVDNAADIIGNPLVVMNGNLHGNAIAMKSFVRTWREQGMNVIETQKQQNELLAVLGEIVNTMDIMFLKTGRYYEKFYYSEKIGYNLLLQKIQINNFDMATLIMIEKDTNILDVDIHVLQVMVGLIAQEFQKVSYFIDNNGDMKASFLVELFNDLYPNRKLIDRKLDVLQYAIKESLYVVIVRFSKRHIQNANMLLFQFQRILTGEIYTIYQNQLVILVNREKNQGIGEYMLNMFRDIANRCHLLIGISQEFHDILETRRYYKQAQKALDYGENVVNKNQKHPLYFFQDYILIEMLEICRKNENLMDYCNPKLMKLLDYDREQGTDYMSTLYEFMENSQNIKRTAEAMFIHKNTLIYRIDKIKVIMDTDFMDSWENFNIYLTFRIIMFTGVFWPTWCEDAEKEHKEQLM